MYTVETANTPVMIDANNINLNVKFAHLDDYVSFTANPDDVMQYGADLFHRALSGEFGPVLPPQG